MKQRDRHIDTVETQLSHINQDIDRLTKELEFKGQEVMRVKSDADEQLRSVPVCCSLSFYQMMDSIAASYSYTEMLKTEI